MTPSEAFRYLKSQSRVQLAAYAVGAVGSVWLLSKLLRALAHYAFPSFIPGETNTVLLASPRPHGDQDASAKDLDNVMEYDYIILGTGTAGAVLASRLTENPDVTVLAIESGHSDLKQLYSRIPAGFQKLFRSAADHDIRTQPQEEVSGRRLYWPRGKMLGGCSAINAMIYNRGAPSDYDEWERLGNPNWAYKDLQHYMRKAECFKESEAHHLTKSDLAEHGRTGPWQIGYAHLARVSQNFIDACEAVGVPVVRDFNTNRGINGVGRLQTFIDEKGQRSSTAVAYLTDTVARRHNLKIAVGQTVTRVLFDESGPKPRAVGVEMAASASSPVRYLAKAKREVIVCAGAVHTPQVLKLSGIGPAEELESQGIKVVKSLPAVGGNLADHLFCTLVAKVTKGQSLQYLANPLLSVPATIEWLRHGTGAMTTNVAESAAFLRTATRDDAPQSLRQRDLSSGPDSADLELLCGAACFLDHGYKIPEEKSDYTSIGPIHLRPASRGTVTLASNDPFTPPLVHANYLSDQHDIDMLLYGLKLTVKLANSPPYQKDFQEWYYPRKDVENMTDKELVQFIRDTCETIYHPMCTAKMGPDPAANVVDPELRVHGVDGLRVVDASIFPTPLACHPCAPVVMVAEKAADLIKMAQ